LIAEVTDVRSYKQNQRLSHHTGQLLTARDLQDDVDYDARMRGLHVRALHGVWGIALGYEIARTGDPRVLHVTQGMAYDCAGREIVMSDTLVISMDQLPSRSAAPAWWFDLLIRYNSDLDGPRTYGACQESCSNGIAERPSWRWSYAGDSPSPNIKPSGFADDVRLGEEIPLARVRITNAGTWTDLDLTVRRAARSLARPHIAAGQVKAGSIPIQGSPLHWTARIDTSSGGFNSRLPFYSVTMTENPLLSQTSGFAGMTFGLTEKQKAELIGPLMHIVGVSKSGFTLEVRTATINKAQFQALPFALQRNAGFMLPVALNWIGMEPNGGCPPPKTLFPFFSASIVAKLFL
jgi:hypothetical protein